MDTPALSAPVLALLRQAEDTPNATIIASDQVEWTSEPLAEESGRVAAGLAARGVKPGDRVALHMHNMGEAALRWKSSLSVSSASRFGPSGPRQKMSA